MRFLCVFSPYIRGASDFFSAIKLDILLPRCSQIRVG